MCLFSSAVRSSDLTKRTTKEGWVYVYLTNESNNLNEVYFACPSAVLMKQMGLFYPKSSVTTLPSQARYQLGRRRDDMEVTLKESPVVQQTDYYPFGLQHNTSWTRASDLKNDMLYNAGSELNKQTKNYETFFRQYDPALGRFTAIDPLASSFAGVTPYNYAFNDPIALNDPNGDYPGSGRGGSVAQEIHDRNFGMRDPGNHSGANGGYGWSNGLGSGGYTGGYDPAMANASLSFEKGLKSLRSSQYGGIWGSDGTTYRFRSDEEAAIAGFYHIYRDGGYRYTEIYRQLNDLGNSIAKAHYGYTGRLPEHNLIASTAPWIFDPRILTQDEETSELRLAWSGVYIYDGRMKTDDGDFQILGGTHIKVKFTNLGFGAQLKLQDKSFKTFERNWIGVRKEVYPASIETFSLGPAQSKSFNFYRFGYAPMIFTFGLSPSVLNESLNVRIEVFSTWIPGDPYDSRHPGFPTER